MTHIHTQILIAVRDCDGNRLPDMFPKDLVLDDYPMDFGFSEDARIASLIMHLRETADELQRGMERYNDKMGK